MQNDVAFIYSIVRSHLRPTNRIAPGHFVFTDSPSLSSARFRSFVRDCRAMERSAEELLLEIDKEKAALEHYIKDQYAHITRTYDPKVRELHKRRKIVIAKGAFDALK
jgi:hypothetical protein